MLKTSPLLTIACLAGLAALVMPQPARACIELTDMYGVDGGGTDTVASCGGCTATCSGVNGGKPETVTVVSAGKKNTAVVTLTGGPYGSCKNFYAHASQPDMDAICNNAKGCSKITLQNSGTAGGTTGTSVGTFTCS
jgi:hypothetical protein